MASWPPGRCAGLDQRSKSPMNLGCQVKGSSFVPMGGHGSGPCRIACRGAADVRIPRGVLVLGEPRAAPIRSECAGALQRGRGTGGEGLVRKCGLGASTVGSLIFLQLSTMTRFVHQNLLRYDNLATTLRKRCAILRGPGLSIIVHCVRQSWRKL